MRSISLPVPSVPPVSNTGHFLHDAGSIDPGNCSGSNFYRVGDPCHWTVFHDLGAPVCSTHSMIQRDKRTFPHLPCQLPTASKLQSVAELPGSRSRLEISLTNPFSSSSTLSTGSRANNLLVAISEGIGIDRSDVTPMWLSCWLAFLQLSPMSWAITPTERCLLPC